MVLCRTQSQVWRFHDRDLPEVLPTQKGGIGNGNLYQGFDIAFRDEAEFRQFLKDYEGTVFKGNWDNQIVLWCFRREYVFLPSAEWETFNAPIETRRLNFHPEQVKIVKDMEKHITYFYRIKPDNF